MCRCMLVLGSAQCGVEPRLHGQTAWSLPASQCEGGPTKSKSGNGKQISNPVILERGPEFSLSSAQLIQR